MGPRGREAITDVRNTFDRPAVKVVDYADAGSAETVATAGVAEMEMPKERSQIADLLYMRCECFRIEIVRDSSESADAWVALTGLDNLWLKWPSSSAST